MGYGYIRTLTCLPDRTDIITLPVLQELIEEFFEANENLGLFWRSNPEVERLPDRLVFNFVWTREILDGPSLIAMSRNFPDVTFRLTCIGDQWPDVSATYLRGGQYEVCNAVIPAPTKIAWRE